MDTKPKRKTKAKKNTTDSELERPARPSSNAPLEQLEETMETADSAHDLSDPNINDFDHLWKLDEEDIDWSNPYKFLARVDWRKYSPAAIKGIAAIVKQLEPESETRYCQLTVSTERKPEDHSKMRFMTFNGKTMGRARSGPANSNDSKK